MSTMVEVMFNLLGDNYRNSSKDAGVDLEKYPDKMLDPVVSARVLIRGIMDGRWNGKGKGIDFYEGGMISSQEKRLPKLEDLSMYRTRPLLLQCTLSTSIMLSSLRGLNDA